MKKHNVLLVCGSGASSGFMAANIRKAAAARGLSITVNARSESTVEDYVDEIDCLMIGPHLASTLPEMEEICEGYDVKVGVIEQAAYARLNGMLRWIRSLACSAKPDTLRYQAGKRPCTK